jgi:nucleotide-binding universal stress UspA family protein
MLKVLLPTDFTVQSDYALIILQRMSERLPLEIHFLHVLNFPETVAFSATGAIETCGEVDAIYLKEMKTLAERKLKELKTTYPNVHTHLELGKTTDTILSFSKSHHFDFIAMGTKGAHGFIEKISGSETQHVARKSTIPVLSLMCNRSDIQLKNIVLVHDFKASGPQNLELLQLLLQHFNATLHLLQISKKQTEHEAIKQNMKTFAHTNGINNYVPHVLEDSDIEQGVIHFNQMQEIDLIYIGTHGKGSFFHTSATEQLINHIYKPIISFPIK